MNQKRTYLRDGVFLLAGSIMVGHGLRMIYQGVFQPGSSYIPNTFDIFFDWLTLAVLGVIIFWFGLSHIYRYFNQKNEKVDVPHFQPT